MLTPALSAPFPGTAGSGGVTYSTSKSGYGNALTINTTANNNAQIPETAAPFAANTNWTIHFLVNCPLSSKGQWLQHVGGNGAGALVFLGADGSSGAARLSIITSTTGLGTTVLDAGATITDGTWHSVDAECVSNGTTSTYTLFRDGTEVAQSTGNNVWGGYLTGGSSTPWIVSTVTGSGGQIDDLAFFNAALHSTISGYTNYTDANLTSVQPNSSANQTALYHFDGNLLDSNTTGLPSATGFTVTGPGVMQQGKTYTLSVNPVNAGSGAVYTGTVTLTFNSGTVPGTLSSSSLTFSSGGPQSVTFTPSANITTASIGAKSGLVSGNNNTQALTVTATSTLPTATYSASVYPVLSTPAAPVLTTSWGPALATTLWADGVYNARTATQFTDLAGDGVTDDWPNLVGAINFISTHGGGVLYLPMGSYNLASAQSTAAHGLQVPPNVAIEGDGLDVVTGAPLTNVLGPTSNYGGGSPADCVFYWGNGGSNNIFYRLHFICQNPSGIPPVGTEFTTSRMFASGVQTVASNLVFKDCQIDTGHSDYQTFQFFTNIDFEDCAFDSTVTYWGTLDIENCTNVNFVRNSVVARAGEITISGDTNVNIDDNQNCIYHWNKQIIPFIETRGFDISYDTNVTMTSNVTMELGQRAQQNDHEAVLMQDSLTEFSDHGTFTGVSGAGVSPVTITDSTKSWGTWSQLTYTVPPFVVVDMEPGSPAFGQWRQMTSYLNHTATTITLDPSNPWTAGKVPQVGDHYFVGQWVINNAVIDHNTFSNMFQLEPYGSAYNVKITNNSFMDSSGIYVLGRNEPNGLTEPTYFVDVHGNYIVNPKNYRNSVAAFVLGSDAPYAGANFAFNRLYGNTVVPAPTSVTPETLFQEFQWIPYSAYSPSGSAISISAPAVVGEFAFGAYASSLSTTAMKDPLFPGANNGVGAVGAAAASPLYNIPTVIDQNDTNNRLNQTRQQGPAHP